jgi:DNA-binding NarL/FixJ family response regulator
MDEVKRFLGLDDRAGDGAVRQGALTPRQLEVLRLVAAGQTDKQIARALALSPRTVEMHVGRALEALACHTRAEAVRKAVELRLLQ